MNRPPPPDENAKFSGNLRHYHRTGPQTHRSWDDWIEGATAKTRRPRNWLKTVGIVGGALALFAITVGLILELG